MKAKALSLILVAILLIGAVCFMAPSGKASTNLITNPGFEDAPNPYWGSPWEGGAVTGAISYTGSNSLWLTQDWFETRQEITSVQDGNYFFSMMFKPNYNSITVAFTEGSGSSNPWLYWVTEDANSIVGFSDGVTNTSVTVVSGGWLNIVFNFDVVSHPILWLQIYRGTGYIDDVWFSTSGAVSFYSSVSLVAPANNTIQSTLAANFTYTPSMNNSIVNASLWLNSYNVWQRVTNTTTVTNGTLNNFTYALPYQGVYLWNIEVWDSSNYFFASSNYSLTITQGTVDHGAWYDPCENISKWSYSGFTPTDPVIDTSDYQEYYGSINFSWTSASSARHEWFDLTPGNCFGFFVKFQINATYSSSASQIMIVYNYTGGSNIGLSILYNGTHYRFGWKWYLAFTYSSWYLIDGSHWYWMECFLVTNKLVDVYVDGAKVFTDTTVVNPVDHLFEFFINNGAWGSSYKFDFLRITDHEEYPVFVTPTIDIVSNPELNAFFSVATNASSLQTETLCVNGNVSENMADLGHVGTFPWLDTQDDNTSYVQTNLATATYDQYYTFNQTSLITISSVTMHIRLACFPISSTVGVLVQVYLWNGSSYVSIEGFQRFGDWLTMNSSTLFTKGFNTSAMLNQMRLKIWMNLNQQVPGITYMGRLTAVWMDVFGYGNPEGSAIHQTPYSFNPVSATYVFNALNSTIYDDSGNEYSFSGFNYTTGSYVGATLILTSLSGITSIVLEYSVVVPSDGVFLVPFMFLFWIIGLFCLFLCPIYAIDKIKKREYLVGMVGGVILGAIGFGLFIGGLWGITI